VLLERLGVELEGKLEVNLHVLPDFTFDALHASL